jgi:sulfite exporter TauE/SafE
MNFQLPECCAPKQKRSAKQIVGIFILVFVLFFVLDKLGILAFSPGTKTLAGLGSVFLFGLAASLSSCTAFSAGILTSIAAQEKKKFSQQWLFHAGRLISFTVFGGLIGFFGGKITFSAIGQNVLTFAVSGLLFFMGMKILGLVPDKFGSFSFSQKIKEKFFRVQDSDSGATPALLGALTFFLPCGFTQSAQLYALSLANPVLSAMTMFVFALGTLPALLGIGFLLSLGKGSWHNKIKIAAGVLTMLLGLSGFQNSLALAGWLPTNASDIAVSAANSVEEQVIEMSVVRAEYEPSSFRVKASVPVLWKITGTNTMGCARWLVSRQLGIETELNLGLNEITFTPDKPGTYAFSCSMGMARGVIVVE